MNDQVPPAVWDPGFLANPYAALRRLREDTPLLWHPRLHAWVLTRYDDVAALADPDRFTASRADLCGGDAAGGAVAAHVRDFLDGWPGFLDPAGGALSDGTLSDGTLAGEVAAGVPGAVSTARPLVRQLAGDVLARLPGEAELDLVGDFAVPLTTAVYARLTGRDPAQITRVRAELTGLLGYLGAGVATRTQVLSAYRSVGGLSTVAGAQPQRLAWSVLTACELSTGLLANAVVTLLRHPEQLDVLLAGPHLLGAALREVLRFGALTIAVRRRAVADHGPIRAGDGVYGLLCAANRDPERFPDPDRFDLGREPKWPQLSLDPAASAEHELALLQAEEAAGLLLRQYRPSLATHELSWPANLVLRYASPLPVRLHPSGITDSGWRESTVRT